MKDLSDNQRDSSLPERASGAQNDKKLGKINKEHKRICQTTIKILRCPKERRRSD